MNSEVLSLQEAGCYHCGETCEANPLRADGKVFCCNGCKTVYEILSENGLTDYYSIQQRPGISLAKGNGGSRYDYLDDDETVEKLTDFRGGRRATVTLYIPNIHCTSCVWLLENLFKLDGGIERSSVNFLRREVAVSYREEETTLRSIVELLASIGYEPELRLERLDKKAADSPGRKLWLKLGVAGFAFGNIMLLSLPDYFSASTLSTQGSFHLFFGILSIVLAVPVLLYSASDYLRSGLAAIKQMGINLDVPISLGILALFFRSVYEIAFGVGAGYMDSFTGLIFFLLIGRLIQKKTYERLSFDRNYKSYLPISVTVISDNGNERSLSIDKLKEGMRMLLRNEELVPADARLRSGSTYVDYSFITGESEPVEIATGEIIYAGGKVIGPAVEMTAVKRVSNSYLTKLWDDAAFDRRNGNPQISSLADRISPHFTLAVIGIAVTAGLFWWPVSMESAVTVFTAVLIIACPCALALSTPFTLGSALNILSRNGVFIKSTQVIENLAGTTAIVFDKTGTITETGQAEISFFGGTLDERELSVIKTACRQSVHPLSRKIESSLDFPLRMPVEQFEETLNKGIRARINGMEVMLGSEQFVLKAVGGTAPSPVEVEGTASVVHVAVDGQWRGWFSIANAYRPGIREELDKIRQNYSTYLLSGDNKAQKKEFEAYFDAPALRFEQTPQQKLDFVRQLQGNGQRVVMIGDGLNDAGALQQSDFGIALTDDLRSFTPACDAIMDADGLHRLQAIVDFSRSSMGVIKASFALSLIYNAAGLAFAVTGQLTPLVAAILMPLSSISIMAFTTALTHLMARRGGLLTWK